MLLSIAMIVKNEEKNIGKCLTSIRKLDNRIDYEIIVVDTGSTDDTIKIAKNFTDKVYEHNWNGNFAEMRNISIRYCIGKWIMILDADEVIESVDEIVDFFKSDDSRVFNCMTLKSKNILSENENEYTLMHLLRLFRNHKEFKYTGRVHEQPFLKEPIGISNITFLHYGYSRVNYSVMQYKYERNLQLLLKNLEEGNKTIYNYFQIAQTYGMQNKFSEALKYIRIAYNLIEKKRSEIKRYLYVYHLYASTELKSGDYGKVIELAEEAIKINSNHLDFYVMLINAYMKKGQYKIAGEYCDKYLALYDKISNGYIVNDISIPCNTFSRKDEIIKDKILCNKSEKEFNDIPRFFESLENESIKEELKEIYLYSLLKLKQYSTVYCYFKDKEIEDNDIQIFCNICDVFKNQGELEEILKGVQSILDIDNTFKDIIKVIYIQKQKVKVNKNIKLNTWYKWKSDYLMELIYNNEFDIDEFKDISVNDLYQYVTYLTSDYKCISEFCKYSEDKFLTHDLKILKIVTTIEDILVLSDSINGEEYKTLLERARINKLNYIKRIYNKEILESNEFCNLIGNNVLIWIEINDLISIYKHDKLGVVRGLRKLIKKYPQYKKMINVFLEDINYKISDEIIEEKEKLIKISEEFLYKEKVNNALEILNELNKMFKYESEILNLLGIAFYMAKDYDNSILYLAMVNAFEENFDNLYNLGCVLQAKKRNKEAKYYYNESYDLCKDNDLKNQILNNVKQLENNVLI